MKFIVLEAAYLTAKENLRTFEGDQNWPGLAAYDRVYALPVDANGEAYTAILRAHSLRDGSATRVEVLHWHWAEGGHGKLVTISNLSADQLTAIAEIKRTAHRWIVGEIDDLPPSTDRHFSKNDER